VRPAGFGPGMIGAAADPQLPGSIQSQDRFVRASYYLSKLPQTNDERQAVAGVFSVMRNVSASIVAATNGVARSSPRVRNRNR